MESAKRKNNFLKAKFKDFLNILFIALMNYFKVSATMKNKLLAKISEQSVLEENIYSHGMLFTIMVKTVDEILNVDKQGRIVLPAHIRKAIGIERGGKLLIRFDGSRIILEPFPKNLKKSVEEWINLVRSLKVNVSEETSEESWKWISREYAKKKLGLS